MSLNVFSWPLIYPSIKSNEKSLSMIQKKFWSKWLNRLELSWFLFVYFIQFCFLPCKPLNQMPSYNGINNWKSKFSICNQRQERWFFTSEKRMFEITCNECGKTATVPFKPKEGKPVYCGSCFSKRVSDRRGRSKLNFSFDSKNAWARRDSGFKGRKEQNPASIFEKY